MQYSSTRDNRRNARCLRHRNATNVQEMNQLAHTRESGITIQPEAGHQNLEIHMRSRVAQVFPWKSLICRRMIFR